ncbi:MAG: TonB-dependent receptor plug domain-containing protein [Thiomicrospira sp.]
MQKSWLAGLLISLTSPVTYAQNQTEALPTISIENRQHQAKSAAQLKDEAMQTQVLGEKDIERKQAANLTQAIQNEPGIQVSTECSICGAKRVTMNGMKGEHTTLLLDGLPSSSILEGFYGYDAIPTAPISRIEISRGSGAALITPEAIGGVVNVITDAPQNNEAFIDLSVGNQGYQKFQLRGSAVSADQRTRALVAAQSDNLDQFDQDNNWISESPKLENRALFGKIWHEFDQDNRVWLRLSDQQSEVFGGPLLNSPFASSKNQARSSPPTGNPQFIGDKVGNRPTATTSPRDWLENISSHKQEISAQWQHDLNPQWQSQLSGAYVTTDMDAIYSDLNYQAKQRIYFVDGRFNYFGADDWTLSLGIDMKQDRMKSTGSQAQYDAVTDDFIGYQKTVPGDAYLSRQYGAYLSHIWTPNNQWELSLGLRLDKLDVEFTDQQRRFNDTLLSPRLHARYQHDFNWSSRLSLGQGYRVPLQFFESEHGIIESAKGFAVAVDELEKAHSIRYTLSFEGAQTDMTLGLAYTDAQNLAMIEQRNGTPTLFNKRGHAGVGHADLSANHQLSGHWSIGFNLEHFEYDAAYRETFTILPIEQRLRLMADYEGHGWQANFTLTGIAERQFSRYSHANYNAHFKDTQGTPSTSGAKSPAYVIFDTRVSKQLTSAWTLYAGVNNLFDYTQVNAGSSPLFYDNQGDLDVTHIWGPMRGRLIYAGTQLRF